MYEFNASTPLIGDSSALSIEMNRNNAKIGTTKQGFTRLRTMLLALGPLLFSVSVALSLQQSSAKSVADKLFARATHEDFIGSEKCAKCHFSMVENFKNSPHSMFMADPHLPDAKRSCEGCHGPGKFHVDDEKQVIGFRKMDAKEASAACMRCHESTISPAHWKFTEHAQANVSCVGCHQIHPESDPEIKMRKSSDPRSFAFKAKVDKKAMLRADEATLCGSCHPSSIMEFRNSAHHPVPEGTMVCSDCHNPHPSKAEKSKLGGFKDACVTCHAERAGPFVFEHDPVAGFGSDGCKECHKPHGANNPAMLIGTTRGLCAQCHTDKLATHFPAKSCWTSGCHVAVHGSNTSPKLLTP
ncbi:MAG: cytochrome c3 family protein [Fimbriimonadaceae bacterium]